jgi:hypothetical protein
MKPHVGQRIAAPFLSVPAEVKTFEPRAGEIRLSSNAWKKARHFGETPTTKRRKRSGLSWRYVVTEAGTDQWGSTAFSIRRPASAREGIFATGFIVHEEAWRERSRHD